MTALSDAAVRRLQHALAHPGAGERYEVRAELGRGGMGTVYLAHDRALGRDVALKALAFEGDAAGLADRLRREARVLARLEHPGIVAVHDVGVLADARPFYVMRLVRGQTLALWPDGRGRGEVLRTFLQVCDAVAFAHARGVIHRDLTPRNVMVGEFGEVLVVDWGVARLLASPDHSPDGDATGDAARGTREAAGGDEPLTRDGAVIGTPGYMPPEQAAGAASDADQRADVYGLGAIMRDLLQRGTPPTPRALAAIVQKATAASPADRYPSAETLAADVRRWLDAEPVTAYRESAMERAARFYGKNQPLILLLLMYAVVRVIILLWRGV